MLSDRPDGIDHRSRHDDGEDCWALYDHAQAAVSDDRPFSPEQWEHRAALQAISGL